MDIAPIYKRVIGLDVHQAQITGCAIVELPDGSVTYERREFGGFKRDRKALAEWARAIGPDVVVMESTGIYWKSPYAALESVGIVPWVVNARHVKAVPGRKTDVADAQWLASLARAGLLKASFIAKADLRSLRHIARQRQKLGGMLASEKNRLHKLLTDAGIRLGVVVSDLHGQSARSMVKALIAGKSVSEVLNLASNRLRASREDIFEALQAEEITPAHRFCLAEIMAHIEELETRMARFDAELFRSLHDAGYSGPLRLLQTLPGIDLMGAAMLLVEIGSDMSMFGSAQRWPPGWVCVRATTSQQASARADAFARATPGYVACCASLHRPPDVVAVRSRTSSRRSTCAKDTSDPSWHWATRCCARSTRCFPKTRPTWTKPWTTRR
jgi:transposase